VPPRRMRRRGRHGPGPQPRQIRGFIEPALLLLLHRGATHGYDLIDGLEDIGFEGYPVDPSTVYRILRNLEAQGMIVSSWDHETTFGPPRRVYRITPAGEAYLSAWVADLKATDRILHGFLKAYDDSFK